MVKFHDGLQKISMLYLIPLMPFDLRVSAPLVWVRLAIQLLHLPGWM